MEPHIQIERFRGGGTLVWLTISPAPNKPPAFDRIFDVMTIVETSSTPTSLQHDIQELCRQWYGACTKGAQKYTEEAIIANSPTAAEKKSSAYVTKCVIVEEFCRSLPIHRRPIHEEPSLMQPTLLGGKSLIGEMPLP